jgi:hypothetical protein
MQRYIYLPSFNGMEPSFLPIQDDLELKWTFLQAPVQNYTLMCIAF